ncbi:MAG: hypothetical protein RID07_04170, partial [Lacipirellulaceae bacterium]
KSFGDFAELTEKVIRVRLADSTGGNEVLECIAENAKVFHGLLRLELPNCQVADAAVSALSGLELLEQLDLSGNRIGRASLGVLLELPELKEAVVTNTNIGWFGRRKLGRLSVKKLS